MINFKKVFLIVLAVVLLIGHAVSPKVNVEESDYEIR